MRIAVTQEDIDWGGPDGGTCPVAIAASRAFGFPVWATEKYLAKAAVEYHIPGKVIADLPIEAREQIRKFDYYDETDRMTPFTFEVTPYED